MSQYLDLDGMERLGLARFGHNVLLHNWLNIINPERLTVGSHVRIDGFSVILASGGVELGSYVHIGSFCNLACSGGFTMGNFSTLSQGVRVYTVSDDYSGESMSNPTVPTEYRNVETAPVEIGSHVIVGSGSVILPGSQIPEGVAIGALSLVKGKLEPWGIYAGIPCRRIRDRRKDLLVRGKALIEQIEQE